MRSFRDVIDACGQATVMAKALGMRVSTIQKWRDRDKIPPEHWPKVIGLAENNGRRLSADKLMRIAARSAVKLEGYMPPKPAKKKQNGQN